MRLAQDTDVLGPWRESAAAYIEPVKKYWDAISAKLFQSKPRQRPRRQEIEPDSNDETDAEESYLSEEVDVVQELPEITAMLDTQPPSETEMASLAKTPNTIDVEKTENFKEILKFYEAKKPRIREAITIQLKDQDEPVTGKIEKFTKNGIMLKVAAGSVEYPFTVMDDKIRMRFFPLETARIIYRRKYGSSSASGEN